MTWLRRLYAGRWWIGYGASLLMVALMSAIVGLIVGRLDIANLYMIYLVTVLAAATAFGSGPAVLVAMASFLISNWFFIDPIHTFTISNSEEWVTLVLFLITAIVTGQLAAGQRRRARQAEQREREAVVLYDVVQLLGEANLDRALQFVAERLRQELGLLGVSIDLAAGRELVRRAMAGDPSSVPSAQLLSNLNSPSELLAGAVAPTGAIRGRPGRWVRIVPPRSPALPMGKGQEHLHVIPIRSEEQGVGVIALTHDPHGRELSGADDRLLSAVASQVGMAVERGRLRKEATEAELLRRTDDTKTALLNAVSHDLKTPLASIMASAGALLQREVEWSEPERREFAAAIEHEVGRLNHLVEKLLDLSRIESGTLQLERGWYDLEVLVDEVLGRLRPLTSHHHVVVDIPEGLAPVPLAYTEIDQVLSNLVENATKYAPPETEIEISARVVGQEVQVEVADQGPGIPPSALPHLFEPFYRVRRGGSGIKGTGLGLAVARGLIQAHGGRIWAENRAEGGARFLFTLPLAEGERGSRVMEDGAGDRG